METKASVVKCKSSNSAKTTRSDLRNKKSRSSADFPPYVMKKRGVYVEKKSTKMGINEPEKNQIQERPKAPPRPRPGNKKFLASVLTILSKSTTGTQYPDAEEPKIKKADRKLKTFRRKPRNDENTDTNNVRNQKRVETNEKVDSKLKAKRKFRSKALNDEVDKEVNQEQVVILRSKKEIIQTPSIYSENDSFNWSNLPMLVKRAQGQNKENDSVKVEEVNNELAKEIMEGRKSRKERRVRIDEPKTLVAETSKPPNTNEVDDTNGKLYNLFVDLLQTTISVYNVETECNKTKIAPSSEVSSTKALEIDESIATKLNVKGIKQEKSEVIRQPSNHFCCLRDLEFSNRLPDPLRNHERQKSPKKRKIRTESFSFMKKPAPKRVKAESVIVTKKSFSKKEKKKDLLNLFKEQLRMDDDAFEEPQNMYQALKVIAQNKRRCQKTIHFEQPIIRRKKDFGFPECMYKRLKVFSPSAKGSSKNKKVKHNVPSLVERQSEFGGSRSRPRSDYTTEYEDSYHSLEVYGYDYEKYDNPTSLKRGKSNHVQKELFFTYHSTPSFSNRSLESKNSLEFTESDSMYFF